MTVLSLFPSRIKFTTPDGYLTPEASRALNILLGRVGGPLGDVGDDVFASVFASIGEADSSLTDMITQPVEFDSIYPDVTQPSIPDLVWPEVMQPESDKSQAAPEAISVGASPYLYVASRDGFLALTGGTVTKQEYGRLATFTDVGLLTSMLPVLAGDTIRVTYTALPTMTFIPR